MADDGGGLSGLAGGLLFLVLGAALAGGGVYLYQDAKQATENAVEVDATVLGSEVRQSVEEGDQSGESHRVYYPVVQYRYSYEGETYTSTNLCPGEGTGCDAAQHKQDRGEVQAFVDEHAEGATVTAYVPPGEPSNAYLVDASASSTREYLILVGFGGLVGLAGLATLVGSVKDLIGL